jgi:hypothetical protein
MDIIIKVVVSTDSDWTAVMVDFRGDDGAHLDLSPITLIIG